MEEEEEGPPAGNGRCGEGSLGHPQFDDAHIHHIGDCSKGEEEDGKRRAGVNYMSLSPFHRCFFFHIEPPTTAKTAIQISIQTIITLTRSYMESLLCQILHQLTLWRSG